MILVLRNFKLYPICKLRLPLPAEFQGTTLITAFTFIHLCSVGGGADKTEL